MQIMFGKKTLKVSLLSLTLGLVMVALVSIVYFQYRGPIVRSAKDSFIVGYTYEIIFQSEPFLGDPHSITLASLTQSPFNILGIDFSQKESEVSLDISGSPLVFRVSGEKTAMWTEWRGVGYKNNFEAQPLTEEEYVHRIKEIFKRLIIEYLRRNNQSPESLADLAKLSPSQKLYIYDFGLERMVSFSIQDLQHYEGKLSKILTQMVSHNDGA